jgi:peptidoglycan/xylan/chitin deacetylase (PgdA/CDA1 family)
MNAIGAIRRAARVQAKQAIKLGLATFSSLQKVRSSLSENILAVLMYHRINDYRGNELSVSPGCFVKQLQWLRTHGFHNITMRELENAGKSRNERFPGRRVLFTFDDGYADNCEVVLPLLKDHGYTGIFYISTDYTGTQTMYGRDTLEASPQEKNRVMTWEQVRRLSQEGMEIGSHTASHTLLPQLSEHDVKEELRQSRSLLEEKLQMPITSFCLPGGAYKPEHIAMIREAGYRSCCTTKQGFWRQQDILEIPRIAVLASDGFFVFKQKLTGKMEWAFPLIH